MLSSKRVISVTAALALVWAAGGCSEDKRTSSKPHKQHPDRPAGPNSPKQSDEELNTVLAKVDDIVITLGQFQEQLNRQSPYIRARYASMEQKKEFLDSLIRFEVLAKEALHRGYDKDPEVVRTMKQVMIQKLMKEEFDQKMTPDAVSDAEIRAYYDANKSEYDKPPEVRVSAIVLKTKAQAQKVATEAQGDAGKTNKGFRDLVSKYSTDEDGKLRGGDLRYFAADSTDVPHGVATAAFALSQTGDVSGAVEGGDGKWYVLKQTGRRNRINRSLDDVKSQIRNKLYRDKRIAAQNDFVAKLRADAKVEINTDNLKKVRIDPSTSGYQDDGLNKMEPSP